MCFKRTKTILMSLLFTLESLAFNHMKVIENTNTILVNIEEYFQDIFNMRYKLRRWIVVKYIS